MADGGREQRVGVFACGVALLFLTAYLARDSVEVLSAAADSSRASGSMPIREINDSAFLAVIAWCLASPFAVWGPLTRCRAQADRVRYGRLLYTWACALTSASHRGRVPRRPRLVARASLPARRDGQRVRARDSTSTTPSYLSGWLDVLWAWVALETYLNRPRLDGLVPARFHGVHRLQRGGGVRHRHAAAGERGTVRDSALRALGVSAAGTAIDHLLSSTRRLTSPVRRCDERQEPDQEAGSDDSPAPHPVTRRRRASRPMNRARLTASAVARWKAAHSPLRLRLKSLPWLVMSFFRLVTSL